MVAVAAVEFCDDFFIESHGCSTRGLICCYNTDLWSGQYINCSNNDNNYSEITCYRFVSKLGNATGSALGVVTTTALIVYLITIVLLKVSNGKRGSKHRKCCTITIQISVALSTAIFTGLFCWLKFESYYSHTKIINAISEILPTGIIIFVYIIFFPWYKFETVVNADANANANEDEDNNDFLVPHHPGHSGTTFVVLVSVMTITTMMMKMKQKCNHSYLSYSTAGILL